MSYKRLLRQIIPKGFRVFFWSLIPKTHLVNTYRLRRDAIIKELVPIDAKYAIREVNWNDEKQLRKAHAIRGEHTFKKVPPRLNSPHWVGLAVFDETCGDIAYIAWVITGSIPYFEEFGINLGEGQFLLKDGYCIPDYRHQGLHSRMEQERINYCIRNGGNEMFIQIYNSNKKGIASVLGNGYTLYKQNYVLIWKVFGVFRELTSFIKNPFKKVVK